MKHDVMSRFSQEILDSSTVIFVVVVVVGLMHNNLNHDSISYISVARSSRKTEIVTKCSLTENKEHNTSSQK